MTAPLTFSPEVSAALDAGDPVVALESTIITHGMPFPQNLDMARQVEAVQTERSLDAKSRAPSALC